MSDLHSSDYASSSSGSSVLKIQNMSSDGLVNDWNYLVLVDASSGTSNVSITLPVSTANSIGKSVTIKKTDNSIKSVCIKPSGTDTIDGSTNLIYIFNQNDCITLTSTDNGKCVTMPDNRQGTGSTASFLRVTKGGQTSNVSTGNPLIFDTIETTIGTGISYNSTTGAFTLSPNRTYKLTAGITKVNMSNAGYFYTRWYNDTTASYMNSGSGGDSVTAGSNTIAGCITTTSITPSVPTTLRCLITGSNNVTGVGETSYPIFAEVEEKSRQATVINTVDYGLVRYTGADTTIDLAIGSKVLFDSTLQNGNMSYSNSMFTLKAGKSYELESFIQIYNSTNPTGARFQFWDYTNDVALPNANATFLSSGGSSGASSYANVNGLLKAQHTPLSDIQVGIKLYGNWGTLPRIVGSGNVASSSAKGGTYFKVTQIGSTAVSGIIGKYIDTPWQSFTPVITATTTNPVFGPTTVYKCFYKIPDKKSMKLNFNLIGTNTGSSIGSGTYKIQIPSGYTMDTNLLQLATATNWYDATNLCTTYMTNGGGANNYWCKILPWSATELVIYTQAGYWASNIHATIASFSFTCEIPLL